MRTIAYLFLSVLTCYSQMGLGQNDKVKNLLQDLSAAKTDSARCDLYIDLSNLYVRQNPDSALLCLDYAEGIAEKNLDTKLWAQINMGDILRNKGNLHYYSNNFPEAIKLYNQASENYQKLIDHKDSKIAERMSIAQAKLYVNMGVTHTNLGNFDQGMQKYLEALRVYEKVNDYGGMASCYLGMANLDYYQKEFDKAISNLQKGSELYEKVGNKNGVANCYNSLGGIYYGKNEFAKAIQTYSKVLNIRIEMNDKKGISTAYTNLANVYIETGELDLAVDYLTKSLAIDEEIGDQYGVAIVQSNIASVYDKMAFKKGIDVQTRTLYHNKSLDYSQKAYENAKQMEVVPLVNFTTNILSKVHRSLGNFSESERFFKEYVQTNDSLYSFEKANALSEMQTRYETEKKQQEIDFLNSESKKQKLITYTFLVGFILVAILSTFLFILFSQKKRANRMLAEQKQQIVMQNANLQQANEEILAQRDEITSQRDLVVNQKQKLEVVHNQITNSIRYAQSIQAAILPSEKKLKEISNDFFVFMRPCELVSGDFFWATTFEDFQVFCVADCTGHGVPGAFMSILGITALNDIVANHRVTKANEILGYLRSSVIEALSQNDPEHLHKDGMDIGLCVFNKSTHELQFAGARISLWVVANSFNKIDWREIKISDQIANENYALFEIKGDIMPVGTSPKMDQFTNNLIGINGNSINIYLATDGFADQFGGKNRSKYGSARLKNLLLGIEEKNPLERKQLVENEFENWKGQETQIDDVIVMSICLNSYT